MINIWGFLMPAAGLEPARCCQQQILSLPRLPFRHAGEQKYIIINNTHIQGFLYSKKMLFVVKL